MNDRFVSPTTLKCLIQWSWTCLWIFKLW